MKTLFVGLAAAASPIAITAALAQDAASPRAMENEIGRKFSFSADALPKPAPKETVRNEPVVVPRDGALPKVPDGFELSLFASGLDGPRQLVVLPNNDVIVTMQKEGYLMLLRDADKDGKAEWVQRYAGGFNAPYGLAYRDGEVLVADQDGIWKIPHQMGNVRASYGSPRTADKLPADERKPQGNADRQVMLTDKGAFGDVVGHRNRELAIGADGRLYVGIGSGGNTGIEPPVKGTVQVFAASGGAGQTFVSGVRNPTGLAVNPQTKELWVGVQERDHMGNELVADYLAQPKPGSFYGWPFTYTGSNPQPEFVKLKSETPALADKPIAAPDLLFQPHSAIMGMAFLGETAPADYRGDLLVTVKGSWNRETPTGYKVVRVPFENGRPTGGYDNFMTGFWASGDVKAEVWGRPTDVAMAADGAIFVVDDTGGTVWRVTPRPDQRAAR